MGNTCYMNASIQCLRRVNELKEALMKYKPVGRDPNEMLTISLAKLFQKLETKGDAVMPADFFQV